MSDPLPLPFGGSLCHRCLQLKLTGGARSLFLRCKAPGLPKYPPQPVLCCAAFVARAAE